MLNHYLFEYSNSKDEKNTLHEYIVDAILEVTTIEGPRQIINILAKSQPESIFNSEQSELLCYSGQASLLKQCIILANNYELFLAPWLADGLHSYSHPLVRQDWKRWFPSAHNAVLTNGQKMSNAVPIESFDGLKFVANNQYKFVIKNHADADNYWHWTFEWLPRLLILRSLINDDLALKSLSFIVIGQSLTQFQEDWIELLFEREIVIEYYRSPILCNNFLSVIPPFPAHHSRSWLSRISGCILQSNNYLALNKTIRSTNKRIYLQRGKARNGRNIINEGDILNQLSLYGFMPLSMDQLSIYEQAHIFSNADIIIGPHGSAFVNMIFCKKQCQIIEFFGPGYLSGHDYSLAFMLGLSWLFIEGSSKNDNPTFSSDYMIDIDKLTEILNRCLASH